MFPSPEVSSERRSWLVNYYLTQRDEEQTFSFVLVGTWTEYDAQSIETNPRPGIVRQTHTNTINEF